MAEADSTDAGNGSNGGSAAPQPFDMDRAIDAALALAAERNWEQVSLLDIARRAGVSLAELYDRAPSKQAVLAAFSRRTDAAILAERDAEEPGDDPARDRLFDVLMQRFDHLQPHRPAIESILAAYRRDPFLAVGGLCQMQRSMACMLEAADISSAGLRGRLRRDGLAAIYLAALRTWLQDDSADLAKTMAALDSYLRRIERPVAVVEGLSTRRGDDTAAPAG